MRYRLVRELAADGVVVAVACRVLAVSTAGYYEWRERAPPARAVADQALSEQIVEIHACREAATERRGCTPNCGSGRASVAVASGWHG